MGEPSTFFLLKSKIENMAPICLHSPMDLAMHQERLYPWWVVSQIWSMRYSLLTLVTQRTLGIQNDWWILRMIHEILLEAIFFPKISTQTQSQWHALVKLLYTLFLGTGNQTGFFYAIWPGQNTVSNLHSQGLSNPRSIAKALRVPLMKMYEFIPLNIEIHTRWWVILAVHV